MNHQIQAVMLTKSSTETAVKLVYKKVMKSTMSKDKPKTMCTLHIVILQVSKASPQEKSRPVGDCNGFSSGAGKGVP